MPELNVAFLIPIGAVVAAFITGTVTYASLVTSKEQKVSEFRQAWIDAFRSELSEFAGHARRLAFSHVPVSIKRIMGSIIDQLEANREDALRPDPFHENRQKMAQCYYSLHLRLNPNESDHALLLDNMERVYQALNGTDPESCIPELESLSFTAQSVLKREWVRVKEGEPKFRYALISAKWTALLLAIVLLGIIGYVVVIAGAT